MEPVLGARSLQTVRGTVAQSEVQQEGSSSKGNERLWLAAILILTFLTFFSTITFGWVYDDPPQIPGNADLRWDRLSYLFTHHLWASANGMTEARFYRPLLAVWFLINKTLFGLDPHWFHLTTVMAHVLATALAFLIARKLLLDAGGALLAAAVFGLHPIQVESVSWISAVNDPLAAVFCFTSFLACKKARSTEQRAALWWVLSGAFFLLALLMKEVSAVLPAIVVVDTWSDSSAVPQPRNASRAIAAVVAAYGVVALAWLLVRRHVLGQVVAAHSSAGWGTVLLTAAKIVLFDLYRVVLPVRLSPHYDFKLAAPDHIAQSLIAIAALVALALLAYLAARRARQLWVAYAWFLFPLLPSLNARWMNEDDFVHDRYMYLSMLGIAVLAGAAFAAGKHRWPHSRVVPIFGVGLAVGLAFPSAIQSQYWVNDVHLFSRGVQVAPNNEWAHLNLGAALSQREKYAEAARHFVRSYELKPGWRAADFAGFAYQKSGDLSEAERWFLLAFESNPSLPDAWFAMGQIRLEQQRPAEAVVYFQKVLALQPDAEGYHYALGSALEQLGQPSAALEAYRAELRLHPYQAGARKAVERLSHTGSSQ
jgi:tetratricopeptide (TPR) repeat protein